MPEVMALFRERRVWLATVEVKPPGRNSHQAGDHAEQRRLSGTIASGYDHGLAGGHTEAQVAEYFAPAPVAGQAIGFKSHHGWRDLFAGAGTTVAGLENSDVLSIFGEVPGSI
jgi:hypothetical protein